jgi:hypothetical protein
MMTIQPVTEPQQLGRNARQVLQHLVANPGTAHTTPSVAAAVDLDPAKVTPALRKLASLGWLVVRHRGGAGQMFLVNPRALPLAQAALVDDPAPPPDPNPEPTDESTNELDDEPDDEPDEGGLEDGELDPEPMRAPTGATAPWADLVEVVEYERPDPPVETWTLTRLRAAVAGGREPGWLLERVEQAMGRAPDRR